MTFENLKKKYAHLKKLSEEGGNTSNAVRNDLIKSDAQRNLKELLEKHPEVIEKEKKEKTEKSKKTK